MKAVTLKDVAAKANVSQAVVSTVLNDREGNGIFVSEATRQRVLEAASELGYIGRTRPLPPVRHLNAPVKNGFGSENRLVALLLGRRFAGNLFTDIFYGVNETLAASEYHAVVLDTYADTYSAAAQKEAEALEYIRENRFAGAILWHEGGHANINAIRSLHEEVCPIIAIDRRVPGLDLDYVGTDNFHAAYTAVTHLIEGGRKHIGHLTSLGMTDAASQRLTGYQQALRDSNLEADPRHILLAMDGGRRLHSEMFRQVFMSEGAPDALFLLSDYWAPVVYAELESLGLRIPEDVALVSFDDVAQPGLDSSALTSMAQDFEGIGKSAAELVLKRIANRSDDVESRVFPARLVIRRSSQPKKESDWKRYSHENIQQNENKADDSKSLAIG
jgi:DNA-binding LacI/PurR family transcriptional regulator